MSIVFGDHVDKNQTLSIKEKSNYKFTLENVALDPNSEQAQLYLKHEGKEILITQLNNKNNRASLKLQFKLPQKFKCRKGKIHVIGFYHPTTEKVNIVEEESSSEKQPSPELRRSTRRHVPVSTTSAVKERQALKNMANLFDLDAKDLEDEDDESFSNKSQEQSEEEEDQEVVEPKKKVKKEQKSQQVFSQPTKNPYQ